MTLRRGLVLGGGGITGIAWETGLLLGLQDLGVDVTTADAVVGTSAGSVVGAQITTGVSLADLFDYQVSPPKPGPLAAIGPSVMVGFAWAMLRARGDLEAFGRIDVFVSNAGICPFHAFLDMPVETLTRTMEVNLHGAYFMTQAAANQMVRQGGGGSIIAVSSISALVGGEMQTHYTPTKAGVHSLMQSCAIALGKHGIRCNSVLPGTILTDINKEDLTDAGKRAYMEGRIPLGRLGQPADLGGPVVFLASDMAAYVTGAALLVDGGAFVNLQ